MVEIESHLAQTQFLVGCPDGIQILKTCLAATCGTGHDSEGRRHETAEGLGYSPSFGYLLGI